jgi:hypothetical protein
VRVLPDPNATVHQILGTPRTIWPERARLFLGSVSILLTVALSCADPGGSPMRQRAPSVVAVAIAGTASFSAGQSAQMVATANLSNE